MIATTRFFTTAAIFSLLFGAALAGAEEIVPLEKLDLTQMTAGFKQPQPNREVTGRPLQIRGKRFKNGVGTHANSKFRVDLHKQAKRFTATVGVDDTAKGNGSVEFLVLGDGRELWKSGVLTRKDGAKPVSVNLTGVGALELRVTDARDGTSDDRADWADAKLALQDGARQPEALPPHQTIALRTKTFQVVFEVGDDDRLYQRVLGGPGEPKTKDHRRLEAYPQAGDGYMWEPALEVVHADGNTSTHLVFENATRTDQGSRGQVTRIQLQDSAYPLKVALCFRIFPDRDVIEQWSEIKNNERKPVRLERMASTSLLLAPEHLTLTHFYGGWANEMIPATEELTDGIKIVDSKMGTRTAQDRSPSFILSLDGPPVETRGRVLAGSLAWSGNFQCAFERLGAETRALCGVNPFASSYDLDAGKTFTTPPIIWVWSNSGLGEMSRKLHSWARDFGVRDGHQPRAVLLNNWEATKFDFDFNRIASLFHPAKQLGFELFLLDDGWFGNKYPRVNDRAGLGDWQPNRARLPGGLAPLAAAAEKDGLRFGIWIEPEMVNPKSDLYDRHPNWVIRQPKRDLDFQRNQLVLDLTRPAVQEFEWEVISNIFSVPGVTYSKWDCNRNITQPGSSWLSPRRQSDLWIDYTKALYALMNRVATNFPHTQMMLCSSGGGRAEYGALKYFHEFWPSDNTDAARRVLMQYDYSYFFPSLAVASHVTRMGNRPLHFACSVAMSARFGMDMDLAKLSAEDRSICAGAIRAYKGIRDIVQLGDLYRLENPHEGPRSALDYISTDRNRAVLFVFQLKDSPNSPVRLQGLDPAKTYVVNELNPAPGRAPLTAEGKSFTGEQLMQDGITPSCSHSLEACVMELAPAK